MYNGNVMKDEKPTEQWLRKMAEAEDACDSVSVGGLYCTLGLIKSEKKEEPAQEAPKEKDML